MTKKNKQWLFGAGGFLLLGLIVGCANQEPEATQAEAEQAATAPADLTSQTDSLGEWRDHLGDFWDHNLRIVQEDNRYIMIVTPTREDPFRQELTELPPEAGMVRKFSTENSPGGDIYAIQPDGNLGLYDSDGLIRVAQKIE